MMKCSAHKNKLNAYLTALNMLPLHVHSVWTGMHIKFKKSLNFLKTTSPIKHCEPLISIIVTYNGNTWKSLLQ